MFHNELDYIWTALLFSGQIIYIYNFCLLENCQESGIDGLGPFIQMLGYPFLYLFNLAGFPLESCIYIYLGLNILYCTLLHTHFANSCHASMLLLLHPSEENTSYSSHHEGRTLCCGSHFWTLLIMCSVFMLFAATTSGLALGLLSFSQVDLEVLVKAGQPQIQKNAGIYIYCD